jgi:hypothetical protein
MKQRSDMRSLRRSGVACDIEAVHWLPQARESQSLAGSPIQALSN